MDRWFLAAALCVGGCASVGVSSLPVGAPAPPRSVCAASIASITPAQAEGKFREVGVLCVLLTGGRSPPEVLADPQAVKQIVDASCALGGDLAISTRSCAYPSLHALPGLELTIYRQL